MISEAIILALKTGPKSLKGISIVTHIAESQLRSTLTGMFYTEVTVNHKDGYKVQAWKSDPNCKIRVDGNGLYYLLDKTSMDDV